MKSQNKSFGSDKSRFDSTMPDFYQAVGCFGGVHGRKASSINSSKELSEIPLYTEVMRIEQDGEDKPRNPVEIVHKENESGNSEPGQLNDNLGQMYLFRTDENLCAGKKYEVDVEQITEKTVRIVDSLNETGYR